MSLGWLVFRFFVNNLIFRGIRAVDRLTMIIGFNFRSYMNLVFLRGRISRLHIMKNSNNLFSSNHSSIVQIIQIKDKFFSFRLGTFASERNSFQKLFKGTFLLMKLDEFIPNSFIQESWQIEKSLKGTFIYCFRGRTLCKLQK